MRIRHLSIKNFRGIRELDWPVPDRTLLCLIGRGDSTKSTILEAIRRIFYPQWNLSFDDADFYQCLPEKQILIEVVLGQIPDGFRDLENYGHFLCGWNAALLQRHDEPGDGLEDALRVRLKVNDDLEPTWRVIKDDNDDGVRFKTTDRAKAAVSLIGAISDRHLTWSRGSLLGNLTEGENLAATLAEAGRAAKNALDARRDESLKTFDAVAKVAEETARSLGVNVASSYKAHLDSEAVSVQVGSLALHDGDIPLRQLGLGSKRMLTTGLQKQVLKNPHITLFDEVEIGLEPHRIARLLEHLKSDTSGQYFLTTHSPVVLRELTVEDLQIVHSKNGKTDIIAANKPALANSIQGKIRLGAEAFLAPKVVVCEGATEAGFLRGLDDYWIAKQKPPFAYQGIALFDANGANKIKEIAENLKQLSYDVAVLADADAPNHFSDLDADALARQGIAVVRWADGLSIEERTFADLTWSGVMGSFEVACALQGERQVVLNQIQSQYGPGFDRNYSTWTDTRQLRSALGKAAKASEWFKTQSKAQEWVTAITMSLEDAATQNTDLIQKLRLMREWIDRA